MQRACGWGERRHALLEEAGPVQIMHEGHVPS